MSRGILAVELSARLPRFDLDARLELGDEVLGLFGGSGAGKSTILQAIAGLRDDVEGRIEFDGITWMDTRRAISIPPERRHVGYLPQDDLLFPHWTGRQNVMAGAARNTFKSQPGPAASDVIEMLELGELLSQSVREMSGGERRRVALARALCSGPSILLLDEPLGSLEFGLRSRILEYLLAAKSAFGIPTLFVTHDSSEANVLCDRVSLLSEGRVVDEGRPGEVFTKAAVLGRLLNGRYENVLHGTVVETGSGMTRVALAGDGGCSFTVSGAAQVGDQVSIGILASEILLATGNGSGLSARNVAAGEILELIPAGNGIAVKIVLAGDGPTLVALVTEAARAALSLESGRPINIIIKAQAFRILAAR